YIVFGTKKKEGAAAPLHSRRLRPSSLLPPRGHRLRPPRLLVFVPPPTHRPKRLQSCRRPRQHLRGPRPRHQHAELAASFADYLPSAPATFSHRPSSPRGTRTTVSPGWIATRRPPWPT
ncbi:unnamed protein product, partial [Musa acuminata subsp. burmannicoides]